MMHKGRVLTGFLCGLVLTSAAFAGSVTGKVVFEGKGPTMKKLDMGADPTCAKKNAGKEPKAEMLVLGEGGAVANIFVAVKNVSGEHKAPASAVVIDQDGCTYKPHVVGVMVGQPLQFKNSDGILHNVHGLPEVNREFNIGMPATLKSKDQALNKPEPLFKVKCDVHPWMNAFVAVMTHPFYAVTGADGTYKIDGLPAGDYEIEAWHERLGVQTTKVTVGDSAATVDFTLKAPKRK
jgi:plastocyanin